MDFFLFDRQLKICSAQYYSGCLSKLLFSPENLYVVMWKVSRVWFEKPTTKKYERYV